MTARQQKKVDRMEINEEKVYTVSQAAMEKIVRTAVAGTTGCCEAQDTCNRTP